MVISSLLPSAVAAKLSECPITLGSSGVCLHGLVALQSTALTVLHSDPKDPLVLVPSLPTYKEGHVGKDMIHTEEVRVLNFLQQLY